MESTRYCTYWGVLFVHGFGLKLGSLFFLSDLLVLL